MTININLLNLVKHFTKFLFCFAEILPDALKTQCSKCSDTQKQGALKVVQRLQKDYPNEWKQLLDKWDPKREYFKKFEDFIKTNKN